MELFFLQFRNLKNPRRAIPGLLSGFFEYKNFYSLLCLSLNSFTVQLPEKETSVAGLPVIWIFELCINSLNRAEEAEVLCASAHTGACPLFLPAFR